MTRDANDKPEEIEAIIEPELLIIDCHHHLWDGAHGRYLLPEFAADAGSGHNIVGSVFVECRTMYRKSGPRHLRSVGEAEFAAGMAAMGESGQYGTTAFCEGIIGYADLRSGTLLDETIESLIRASGGRLRGIRQPVRWSVEEMPDLPHMLNPEGLMQDVDFRRGFERLGKYGLIFDAFLLHTQLGDLLDLVKSTPATKVVINHLGGPVGFGPYALRKDQVFADWSLKLKALAACDNVSMKLGGLGMPFMGLVPQEGQIHSSLDLAERWSPYILNCIDIFGPQRCMFESNFPVDRRACTYRTLWNAFKRVAAGFSGDEKHALFSHTAARAYHLEHECCKNGQQR